MGKKSRQKRSVNGNHLLIQPRSQGLRGETVTKTLVKFVLSFQNFGEKIACAVRHNRIQPLLQYGCVALRMRFFSQNFGTIKRILPGSSSPSHREGPGTEVATDYYCHTQTTAVVFSQGRSSQVKSALTQLNSAQLR